MHDGRVHCCQGDRAARNRLSVAGTKKLSRGLDAGCFMTVDRDRSRIGDEPTKSERNPSRANSPESKCGVWSSKAMSRSVISPKARKGFTLVELAVVIVIIGVLAAFGVPRFLKSVERSKASEAFAFLSAVRSSQERYLAQYGEYCTDISKLDIQYPTPAYFSVSAGSTGQIQNSWTLTLTRTGASAGYGAYTVIFTDQGYDATNSGIQTIPDINPISNSISTSSGS